MRQYTTPEQTAKLIELGFEKPSSIASVEPIYGMGGISVAKAYTIGELIELLPKTYNSEGLSIGWHYMADVWIVRYPKNILIHKEELIDALYDMIIWLKEKGVI